MNIVRGGNYSKKCAETVCIHCGKMFKDMENQKKHMERYHPGNQTSNQTVTGKKQKEYVCVQCSHTYVNQCSLINHMIICRGDMCLQALSDISDQETEEACIEVEVCKLPVPLHPNAAIHEYPNTSAVQLSALVSNSHTQPATTGKTVFKRSHQVTDPNTLS